jgi:hypothetical protein
LSTITTTATDDDDDDDDDNDDNNNNNNNNNNNSGTGAVGSWSVACCHAEVTVEELAWISQGRF